MPRRIFPDLFIVGSMKSGTTTLHEAPGTTTFPGARREAVGS